MVVVVVVVVVVVTVAGSTTERQQARGEQWSRSKHAAAYVDPTAECRLLPFFAALDP